MTQAIRQEPPLAKGRYRNFKGEGVVTFLTLINWVVTLNLLIFLTKLHHCDAK